VNNGAEREDHRDTDDGLSNSATSGVSSLLLKPYCPNEKRQINDSRTKSDLWQRDILQK
jgi:hypothetical protein